MSVFKKITFDDREFDYDIKSQVLKEREKERANFATEKEYLKWLDEKYKKWEKDFDGRLKKLPRANNTVKKD